MENDFYITLQLGYRSVAEMRKGLSHHEYVQWTVYFGRRRQDEEQASWRR